MRTCDSTVSLAAVLPDEIDAEGPKNSVFPVLVRAGCAVMVPRIRTVHHEVDAAARRLACQVRHLRLEDVQEYPGASVRVRQAWTLVSYAMGWEKDAARATRPRLLTIGTYVRSKCVRANLASFGFRAARDCVAHPSARQKL